MLQSFRKIGLIVFFAIISISVNAEVSDLPVKVINGKSYYYYEVQPQETVYSLCRKIGITRQALIAANPSVADGLKAYQTLLFPIESSNSNDALLGSSPISDYKVQSGETGYGISRKFEMTLDEFYMLNPDAVEGIKSGQIVKVKSGQLIEFSDSVVDSDNVRVKKINDAGSYLVKSGDTFFGIAQRHGLGVEQLREANPNIDVLKAGMELILPQACDETLSGESKSLQDEMASETMQDRHRLIKTDNMCSEVDTLVIALALPLKASVEKRDVRTANTVEFYRGFMMAVDSLRSFGKPLKILTFDTEGSDKRVNDILSDGALRSAHIILAPDAVAHFDMFAKYAADNEIYVLNQFIIKDQSYKTNPYVMQSNIPHEAMYQKAIDYYIKSFPSVTPVFLKRTDGKVDKMEFINHLKTALSAAGRKYHEIEFKDKLSSATLSQLPEGIDYAFIPVSSAINELNRFVSAITKFKAERVDSNICMWGYAEWLTARGETLDAIHSANSYIFSRFYSVDKDLAQDELKNKYHYWYGVGIVDKVPRQGVYGFDTGMFIIRALNSNSGDFRRPSTYYGIQNSFGFIEEKGGGLVNDEMFIINFAPGNAMFKFGL